MTTTVSVLEQVFAERSAQEAKWGQQNHPDVSSTFIGMPVSSADWHGIRTAPDAKRHTDNRAKAGKLTYADILIEEVAEAVESATLGDGNLRAELIQVAAVAVAWVEKIDRQAKS